MAKQKRNAARGSKKSTEASSSVTQSATDGVASGSTSPQSEPLVPFSTIKLEYERAFHVVKNGNHNKALKIMKDLVSRHKNSAHLAWIHRFQSTIFCEAVAIIDDPSTKKEHAQRAVQSARKAVELSPCSLKFAYYYAKLLFGQANDWTEYEQVVKECERAIDISEPIDPAEQSLKDERLQELSTAEARIAHVKNKLRKLIDNSNLASLVTNEVQLAASSSSGSGQRRKSGGHVLKEADSRDLVSSYWKAMSFDSKKEFLRIKVSDLKSHVGSSEDIWLNPNDIVEDALRFAMANNKTWKYWLCCYCLNKRFPDSESLTQHVRNLHVLPQNVDVDWIEMMGLSKSPMCDLPNETEIPEIKENISLNEDETCLVLDERLVPAEISAGATDPFLTSIFSGSSCWDELDSFKKRKQDRRPQGIELINTLNDECKHLQSLSETKSEQKNYEEALQIVQELCQKGKQMENFTELVLKEGKEELIKGEKHVSNRFKLEAIKNVLKEARAMMNNVNHSGEEEDGVERLKDYFREMDSYIEIAIQKLKENQSVELGKTEAQIMTTCTKIKHLEPKLDPASAFDFRETLLPMVKSYLRARLEDLAEKEAKKKSDASAQELLDLEASQQDVAKPQESDKKPKDKGKKKQKGKTENLKKATHDHEQPIEDSTTTPGSSFAMHDDDKVKDHGEKNEEEELGLRQKELEQEIGELLEKLQNTKLEEEEKTRLDEKLNQKLELQTQLANEASMMQHGWQQK